MTNLLSRKLRSKAGASMILALVFLLFCTFVGGSVLTSATANAYRVEHLSDQQDFLNQRSAALLLSDLLQQEEGEYLQLKVTDAMLSIQEVEVGNGGVFTPVGDPTPKRVITFVMDTNDSSISSMQQLMLETTAYRYLREYASGQNYTGNIELSNFPNGLDDMDDFLFRYTVPSAESSNYEIEGTLDITNNVTTVALPEYTADFSSGRGDDLYNFYVDFGDKSLIKITMRASSGITSPITATGAPTKYEGKTVQITTTSTQTTISWREPLIEKGGAGA